ncbi:Leucine--tRNA ligase [Geodia barretti]|nr:Leucine--tRNA ligase [Geodia barretti]
MRGQMASLGLHFNWDRELSTCSPEYYKWTQWLFLQLFRRGLAYQKQALVNWDPVDKTVLANEQVDDEGRSWRSGALAEKRYLLQWFFKITHYAEQLLSGLETLEWPASVKLMQTEWIGKSEGAFFDFQLRNTLEHHHPSSSSSSSPSSSSPSSPSSSSSSPLPSLRVFTTRPETLFGVNFLAVSPEHPLLLKTELFSESVMATVEEMRSRLSHHSTNNDSSSKHGVFSGLYAVHPFTGSGVPVYVADYVVSDYGTKAVMGVPAHDARDLQFAAEHRLLPVTEVVSSDGLSIINSYQFSGLSVEEGSKSIVNSAHSQGFGGHMTQYKLRDWLISRQRYWGAPIPVLHCRKCGVVPVPETQLPVILPTGVEFKGRGPSPLSQDEAWLRGDCGKPGCCARRETDTMDTFVDSSWYFLRFIDPHLNDKPFSEAVRRWMPVDLYVGGVEHAILHLLYARFITHFLHDQGFLSHKEPFQKLLAQGMVQGKTYRLRSSGRYLRPEEREGREMVGNEDDEVRVSWEKMSKSKYNGVDPEDVIREYGADTVRVFMLFKAPPELDMQWDTQAIRGMLRWLGRVWTLTHEHVKVCQRRGEREEGEEKEEEGEEGEQKIVSATHRAIQEVTASFTERHTFNVAVSELMILSNTLRDGRSLSGSPAYHSALETLCLLLAPMAPHVTAHLWEDLQGVRRVLGLPIIKGDVLSQPWPQCDESLPNRPTDTVEFVLQVNGRKRAVLSLPSHLVDSEDLSREVVRGAVGGGSDRGRGRGGEGDCGTSQTHCKHCHQMMSLR